MLFSSTNFSEVIQFTTVTNVGLFNLDFYSLHIYLINQSSGFVYIALQWFVGWFAPKKPLKSFPPIRSNYLKMPGTHLASLIRKREITSSELVELYIDRIVEVKTLLKY